MKQWSKQIGDYVKQDEEIATIETDKVSLIESGIDSQQYLAVTSDVGPS